jgi:hypothetical protein
VNKLVDRERFTFGVKEIDDILFSHTGIGSYVLYQESIMEMLNYAGIDKKDTYSLLKSISKKRLDVIKAAKETFIEGMVKRIMEEMFRGSFFDRDISRWNVKNVTDMCNMFYDSLFNQDISGWNIDRLLDFAGIFNNSKYSGNLCNWIRQRPELKLQSSKPDLFVYKFFNTWIEYDNKTN